MQHYNSLYCATYCTNTGEEAVKARNVFYYLTYNGAVDLDTIDDPKLKQVS